MIVQHIDDKWELALMPQGIGGEFVQAMPIDLAFAVRVCLKNHARANRLVIKRIEAI
jgi:hypothetical protein